MSESTTLVIEIPITWSGERPETTAEDFAEIVAEMARQNARIQFEARWPA